MSTDKPHVILNPASFGGRTGHGFAQNIGMLMPLDEQLEAIRFGRTHHLDIARIEVDGGMIL